MGVLSMIISSFAAVSSDGIFTLTSIDQPLWLIIVAGVIIALIGGLAIITITKNILWPTDPAIAHLEKTASAARAFLEWARENEPDDITMAQAELGIALHALGEYQISRDSEQGGTTLVAAQSAIAEALAAFETMHATPEITRMREHLFQINTMIARSVKSGT